MFLLWALIVTKVRRGAPQCLAEPRPAAVVDTKVDAFSQILTVVSHLAEKLELTQRQVADLQHTRPIGRDGPPFKAGTDGLYAGAGSGGPTKEQGAI
jgi:hypothetical protein